MTTMNSKPVTRQFEDSDLHQELVTFEVPNNDLKELIFYFSHMKYHTAKTYLQWLRSWNEWYQANAGKEGKTPENWRKAAYYHYYEYPAEHMVKRHYGIRTQDFKLIHFYNDIDEWEMYDMKKDPQELNNVYQNPEYREEREALMTLLKETQELYKDTDPDEKVKELFHGDRRFQKRQK